MMQEADSSDATEISLSSSSSDGTYTPETSSSGDDSEDAFTDHSEEFDYDEETKTYSVQDWPYDVWKEHYDCVEHLPQDTSYYVDDGQSHSWSITEMPGMALTPDPVVLAHIAACDKNEKFTYGDEQLTSTKAVNGKSDSSERPDRRLKTTFSIASKHFHGIPPGRRTSNNPRVYVSAMQVANVAHIPDIDAVVTLSPGMLAYVEEVGWCIIQNITAYNKGPER